MWLTKKNGYLRADERHGDPQPRPHGRRLDLLLPAGDVAQVVAAQPEVAPVTEDGSQEEVVRLGREVGALFADEDAAREPAGHAAEKL